MFGYVRPVLNQLSAENREAYQSAYCGLCHTMGARHGFLARFTLNYDFTLLAMLHYSSSAGSSTVCRRCMVHPFRKERRCLYGTALETAADESMILTWHKLSDDVKDHGFMAGLLSRLLRRVFRKAYRRAALARPEFDQVVAAELGRLNELEQARSPQLDRVADTFAKILAAAALNFGGDPAAQRPMEQLLYHLGRWIYLADAWDDLQDDRKAKRYNPLDERFGGNAAQEREYIETTMTHSARLSCAAANLLDLGTWTPIVENILNLGLPAVQSAVLDGRWKELRKQGRKINERSI